MHPGLARRRARAETGAHDQPTNPPKSGDPIRPEAGAAGPLSVSPLADLALAHAVGHAGRPGGDQPGEHAG
jgi:hypothetical protein